MSKSLRRALTVAGIIAACAGSAFGALSPEEALKLGKSLTELGAEKAGNADGSIPEYTGGLTTPPANYKKGSAVRPDPFSAEKPLYVIDGKNAGKFGDKLTEGTKALLKKHPDYQLNVYKTHRTAAFPKSILENTRKSALTAKTANDGLSLVGVREAYPFPIPKNGKEAMWNHLVSYHGRAVYLSMEGIYTNSAGRTTMVNLSNNWFEFPYWVPGDKTGVYYWIKTLMTGPPRRAGEGLLAIDPLDIATKGRSAWQYLPGQRRVKLAPEIAYDTPDFNMSGVNTFDDVLLFNGAMDRYDFRLVGKKEMFVPYNCYKLVYQSTKETAFGPRFIKPEQVRWELHRVWVVEATLKPGKRHIYKKRVFYLDEDSWHALASDQYDGNGHLYRIGYAYITPSYDELAPFAMTHGFYDLIANSYTLNFYAAENGGVKFFTKPFSLKERTPDALAGSGIR
ncbi:DUF1329 domain-containing protein [Geomonas azotofigens]|uniref:DUF1329 domain-containing protein n=1 Tax=Geomonas azotofigens TaxID=2843196 RepID=UPI001C0F9E5E|nr:DUF1329 domain-containing protein [Geomonas azotofigens]MBU5613836.1 DUF1329 domain-containing protein [Geomonas azotofigens]